MAFTLPTGHPDTIDQVEARDVLDSTAGLYGDFQGIAGRVMAEIESLDVLMIESYKPE